MSTYDEIKKLLPMPDVGNVHKRTGLSKKKALPSHAPTMGGDFQEALERIEKKMHTEDDVKDLEKKIDAYRKAALLPILPEPLEHVGIPSDTTDYETYATQYESYIELYNRLNTEPYTEAERTTDILAGMAFLFNAKYMKPTEDENIYDFYLRCEVEVDKTLAKMNKRAREMKLSVGSYFIEQDIL